MRALFALPLLALSTPALAATPCAGVAAPGLVRVTIEAHGVRDAAGQVAFTVYPDLERRFLAKRGKLARVRTAAVPGTTSACFWLAPGSYPVAIYHDANGDRDFNRTLLRPKEGFGFSNDAPTLFGLPSFRQVRTAVGADRTLIRIRMRYP